MTGPKRISDRESAYMSDFSAPAKPEATASLTANAGAPAAGSPKAPMALVGLIALTVAAFARPLWDLVQLALGSDFYSHTLLIPLVSIYLAWDNRRRVIPSAPQRLWAAAPLLLGAVSLVAFFRAPAADYAVDETKLAYGMVAFVSFVIAANCLTLGRQALRTNLFPLLFLYWMCPFTADLRNGIEAFLQYTSADVSYWLIETSGIPIFRSGLVFEMPTIALEVAPECSGIRSSLVLFITSLVASYLFLKSPWKRTALVLFVIPLGILRNGIRILVLAQLCYRIGPEMIHSWFHRSGGPPLFALSLIPLFALLYLFYRSERRLRPARSSA